MTTLPIPATDYLSLAVEAAKLPIRVKSEDWTGRGYRDWTDVIVIWNGDQFHTAHSDEGGATMSYMRLRAKLLAAYLPLAKTGRVVDQLA